MRCAFPFVCALLMSAPAVAAPTRSLGDESSAERLREEGNEATLAMRYADALAFYQRALQAAPEQVGLHYSLARAHQFLGEYPEALAELERFSRDASAEAKARVGRLDELFAQLRPRVSTLRLTCDVAGARVLVRDRVIGVTPLPQMALPAGATTLQVELDGYFTETREVTLPGNGQLAIDIALHAKSSRALLWVQTEPLGADVQVDGESVGTTNPKVEIAIMAGAHKVVARKSGYSDAKVPIVLASGATRELSIPLQKARPVTSRWWFWTSIGAVVAGGVALAVVFTTERPAGHGSLPPGQVGAP